jgi:hypothetical protein
VVGASPAIAKKELRGFVALWLPPAAARAPTSTLGGSEAGPPLKKRF